MNKRLYLIPGLSLLLLAGCFEDSQNSGLGAGTGLYNGAAINPGQISNVPKDPGNGGGSTSTGGDIDPTTGLPRGQSPQSQGTGQRFYVRPAAERDASKGTLFWQQKCKEAGIEDLGETATNSDQDLIPDDCEEKVIGTNPKVTNGFISTVLEADQDMLLFSIKERRAALAKSNSKEQRDLGNRVQEELNTIEKLIASKKNPGITINRYTIENAVLGTTILNRLMALYLAAYRTIYDSDIPIFQHLYAELVNGKKWGGSMDRGHKLFPDTARGANSRMGKDLSAQFPIQGDVDAFGVLWGGYERKEHLYLNLEAGESQIFEIGGVGGSMRTAENTKNTLLIAFYEGFYDQRSSFDAFIGTASQSTGGNVSSKQMEGAVFLYSNGSLQVGSADLGEGLGRNGVGGKMDAWKSDFWKKHPNLKTGSERDIISNSAGGSKGAHMVAIFISEQKSSVIPAQVFGHFPNTSDKDYPIELLPGHIVSVCPSSVTAAKKIIAYEALQYCPGYEKIFSQENCSEPDVNGFPQPCPQKYGKTSALDNAERPESDTTVEGNSDDQEGNALDPDDKADLVADIQALQQDLNDHFTTAGANPIHQQATPEQLRQIQAIKHELDTGLLPKAQKVKKTKKFEKLSERYEALKASYDTLEHTVSAQPVQTAGTPGG